MELQWFKQEEGKNQHIRVFVQDFYPMLHLVSHANSIQLVQKLHLFFQPKRLLGCHRYQTMSQFIEEEIFE